MIEFFMPMEPPTVTLQAKQINTRTGKVFDSAAVRDAKAKLESYVRNTHATLLQSLIHVRVGSQPTFSTLHVVGIRRKSHIRKSLTGTMHASSYRIAWPRVGSLRTTN